MPVPYLWWTQFFGLGFRIDTVVPDWVYGVGKHLSQHWVATQKARGH